MTEKDMKKSFISFVPGKDKEDIMVETSSTNYLEQAYMKEISPEDDEKDTHSTFLKHCMSGGGVGVHLKDMEHSKNFYQQWVEKMPRESIANANLLKHTLAD
eukprot:UN00517